MRETAGSQYDIPVVINNWGKSDAKDFNVNISIDGEVFNETIDEIEEAGQDGSSKTLTITMPRAPLVETTIKHNVTVVVDSDDKVKELINKYRRGKRNKCNGEANNNWTGEVTVSVESGGWDLRPGGGGGTGEEWGEGTDTGEGGAGGAGTTTGSGGEGAVGEKGGKAITGYLMKGTVAQSEEGGGGKGEFLISWVFASLGNACSGCHSRLCWILIGEEAAKT